MDGVFWQYYTNDMSNITDGTSNTVLVAEVNCTGYGEEYINGAAQPLPCRSNGGGVPRGRKHSPGNNAPPVMRAAFVACVIEGANITAKGACSADPAQGCPMPRWSWTRWNPAPLNPTFLIHCGFNIQWTGASSMHPGGMQVCLGDGSVDFLAESMDYATYGYLCSMNSGQPIKR
jgi:hypothetical protein